MQRNDLTGQQFGRWTVMSYQPKQRKDGKLRSAYLCRCSCGTESVIDTDNLKSGRTLSCGCLKVERQSERQKTHGESDTKLYNVWCAIKRRCYNKNTKAYSRYGGRGISMCAEWKESYESFRDWAYDNGYCSGLTVDRINNDGDYSPDNCRLTTIKEQCNNRSTNRKYTLNGETHNVTEWAEIVGIPATKIFCRIYNGWSFERAIATK